MADHTQDEKTLKRKDIWKAVRTVLQSIALAAVIFLAVRSILTSNMKKELESNPTYITSTERNISHATEAGGQGATGYGGTAGSSFIAISYNGLTTSEKLDSKIVTQQAFNEQIAALHESGYVTITQQDVLDYYLYHGTLPEKAMLLIFEDGIFNTATLAQPAMEKYGYLATMCTYAQNLTNSDSRYITTANMKELLNNTYWELGSNGYRLAYINVFDRYRNYFGHLISDEYVLIHDYLKRDYNHYLMDFLRDRDRLREETEEEMEERIAYDYEMMRDIYSGEIGYVPSLYVLMHSNTSAFGNDPLVSDKNYEMMQQIFGMNFNRQGSCLNTLDASIYDLTRLQSRHYFSTNHLLMRIWDDTGDEVAFVVGDEEEAKNWNITEGVAEFRGDEIILTSEPYANGYMTLEGIQLEDLDMTVTLQGNKVGKQSIVLRADSQQSSGVVVALENNELVVRNLTMGEESDNLFSLDLFTFDGGPYVSEQENELEGLIALQKAIIDWDTDEERVREAKEELAKLEPMVVVNIEEGGTPYVPDLDISERDERRLRIQLVGTRMNLWLDDRLVAEQISVGATGRGQVALGSGVWKETDRFSQTNLYDDVYDAVFIDPIIRNVDNAAQVYYSYTYASTQPEVTTVRSTINKILNFFIEAF